MPEPRYRQRPLTFGDMAKGGYFQEYAIYDGEKQIGRKTIRAETRRAPVDVVYTLGDQTFSRVQDFIRAYESGGGTMKVSLQSQIAEVERELALRRNVYARETNPRKQSENELHMKHMYAVLVTLQWLQSDEAKIKQRLAA